MEELIDTTTSTNGLNPLPNGSITVSWFANCSNFDPFYGYYGSPPYYTGGGPLTNPKTGEQEVYATFLRDGINFGPNTSGSPAPYGSADNPLMAYYSIDVTGLKSLFSNPFVVEMIASADSMNLLTNALVTDVSNSVTYALPYPNTPPANPQGGAPWLRGIGGGLSLASGVFTNTDHLHIASAIPQHGGSDPGFDNSGTVSGFIITDKPVVSMPPTSVPLAQPGDMVTLSAYAIGVPPLAYQWRFNGHPIPGATTLTNVISSLTAANAGSYDLVVTNAYGSTTSRVSIVGEILALNSVAANIVYDSNPGILQHDGVNMGATWQASNSDGTVTRTGVMSFAAEQTNGISVADSAVFDSTTNGTITFWMESSGTDGNAPGNGGAALFGRTTGPNPSSEFLIYQDDSSGVLTVDSGGGLNNFNSVKSVSDSKWHFVAVTFDESPTGVQSIYIDGALDTADTNAVSWTWPSGTPLEIGYTTDTAWRDYNGLLDDFRFYSAVLSPSEISAIYAAGNSVVLADPADLQLQFNFTTAPGGALVFSWSDTTAVLQTASSVEGPWVPVTGVSSPYTVVPSATQQYFRYSYTTHAPQAWISNPYLM